MSKQIRTQKETVPQTDEVDGMNDASLLRNISRKLKVQFRNESQRKFLETIEQNQITLCSGPAGTGKSYLAISKALQLLCSGQYKRILVIKPVVEAADEKLGALPGALQDKLEPYNYSTRLLFSKIIGERRTSKLIEKRLLDFTALAYLRGVNIDNTVLIFEEAQNATRIAMKTLLTRIGENCKFIVNGDLEQKDKKFAKGDSDGLSFAIEKLKDVNDIGIHAFTDKDIVRNPIIGVILKRFNGDIPIN